MVHMEGNLGFRRDYDDEIAEEEAEKQNLETEKRGITEVLLKKYVCTLKQGKRLKDLGINEESSLFWILPKIGDVCLGTNTGGGHIMFEVFTPFAVGGTLIKRDIKEIYSAWTPCELLPVFPGQLMHDNKKYVLRLFRSNNELCAFYQHIFYEWVVVGHDENGEQREKQKIEIVLPTEETSLGGLLIYLLENKLITIEEVNKKLK